MPAHGPEIDDAEREGVQLALLAAPSEVVADDAGSVRGLRCTKMALGEPDASGRRRPEPVAGSEFTIDCEIVITAIGMAPDTRAFADIAPTNGNGTLRADPTTLQTEADGIFAAGDVVTGPTDITRAVGEGRRAAFMIDRWLTGGTMSGFDDRLPVVDKRRSWPASAPTRRALPHRPTPLPIQHRVTSPRSSRR